jgi:hypothetical protein
MSVSVTVQFNKFDKSQGKNAVRISNRFENIVSVAPFGNGFVALTQQVGNDKGSLLIPNSRIYQAIIQEIEDVPEEIQPEIYVPPMRVVTNSDPVLDGEG